MSSEPDEIKKLLIEIKRDIQKTQTLIKAIAISSGINEDEIKRNIKEIGGKENFTDPGIMDI